MKKDRQKKLLNETSLFFVNISLRGDLNEDIIRIGSGFFSLFSSFKRVWG